MTVQLDGVAPGLVQIPERVGLDRPVFVDESGRRGRTYRTIGVVLALACAGYALVIAVTLMAGNSSAPWLPVEGPADDGRPAGQVEPSQVPAEPSAGSPEVTTDPAPPAEDPGLADPSPQAPSSGAADEPTAAESTEPGTSASPSPAPQSSAPSAPAEPERPSRSPAPEPSGEPEPSEPAASPSTAPSTTPAPAPLPATGGAAPVAESETAGT